MPDVLAQHTVTLPFNDLDALKAAFDELGDEIACVITEPVTGNMNCILPEAGYLEGMRELCTAHGASFIFDEVMTGFRFEHTAPKAISASTLTLLAWVK